MTHLGMDSPNQSNHSEDDFQNIPLFCPVVGFSSQPRPGTVRFPVKNPVFPVDLELGGFNAQLFPAERGDGSIPSGRENPVEQGEFKV